VHMCDTKKKKEVRAWIKRVIDLKDEIKLAHLHTTYLDAEASLASQLYFASTRRARAPLRARWTDPCRRRRLVCARRRL
jgi:hypothetical protein